MPHAEGCELACGSCSGLRWDLGEYSFGVDDVLPILVLQVVVCTLLGSSRRKRCLLQNERRKRKHLVGKIVEAFVRS